MNPANTAPRTAAASTAARAAAKRDTLIDYFAGQGTTADRAIAHVLRSLSVWTDGPRRVVADVPDTPAGARYGRQLTAQVLDDAAPGHFDTAVIEQVSDTRAILHLAPRAGEIR